MRLLGLRVALQPQRSQAVHIFDHRLLPGMLLLEGILNLRLPTLVLIEYGFGHFAMFCAHHNRFFMGECSQNAQREQKFLAAGSRARPISTLAACCRSTQRSERVHTARRM